MTIIGRILGGTPPYVWAIFAGLLALGLRRLKPRRTHLAVAAAAPLGFAAWSLSTIAGLAAHGNPAPVIALAGIGALAGFASGGFRLVPRPAYAGGGLFDFPATRWPLILYMALFWVRYVLEVMRHIDPARATLFASAGLVLTSFTAGRTLADFLPLARAARSGARITTPS